ncbi:Hypothetical protein Cul131001_1224 [Corynebacterium ulcerans]|nr:Hypothetical protein Cul131001_1224 [Corynebacterium ulcerans]
MGSATQTTCVASLCDTLSGIFPGIVTATTLLAPASPNQ